MGTGVTWLAFPAEGADCGIGRRPFGAVLGTSRSAAAPAIGGFSRTFGSNFGAGVGSSCGGNGAGLSDWSVLPTGAGFSSLRPEINVGVVLGSSGIGGGGNGTFALSAVFAGVGLDGEGLASFGWNLGCAGGSPFGGGAGA